MTDSDDSEVTDLPDGGDELDRHRRRVLWAMAVAIERDALTMRLVQEGGTFSVSLLPRSERAVVRHFVKPVVDVERSADGTVVAMSGHAVNEVGPHKLPVLASAVGYLYCPLTSSEELGSHVLCIGEVVEVGGEPSDVLRMEDTRMHYGG
jgi:flavin reductase (DIM6/NTAB) family NADH-FMN oxidoreductase RutF